MRVVYICWFFSLLLVDRNKKKWEKPNIHGSADPVEFGLVFGGVGRLSMPFISTTNVFIVTM